MRDTTQKKLAKFWYHLTLSRVRSTPIFCLFYAGFFEKGFLLKTEMKGTMIKTAQWPNKIGSIHILLVNQEIILSFIQCQKISFFCRIASILSLHQAAQRPKLLKNT